MAAKQNHHLQAINKSYFYNGMRKLIPIFLILLGGLTSCDKQFEELNTNPNQPTITNPDFLWTEAAVVSAGQFSSTVHSEIWTLMEWTMMMGDLNGIPVGTNPYAYNGDWSDELWDEWYTRILSPVNEIIKLTKDNPFLVNKYAIARIWRAWAFHRITDLWGSVPYFQALQGVNPDGDAVLTPVYDSQELIYQDLLNELKEAVASFNADADIYGSADPYFGGDLGKWQRFANTLRLRLALRISNVAPGLAMEHGNEVLAGDLISSNADGFHFQFVSEARSPFEELSATGQGMRNPSHFLIELLKTNGDPRISIFAEPTTESTVFGNPDYAGVPNLWSTQELAGFSDFNTSPVGALFLQSNTQGTTLSYAESCFLQAEAALLGWSSNGTAQSWYEEGVRAHMDFLNVSQQEADDFLNAGGAFDGTLEQIITQKWLTFIYRDGFEAFAEIRRTGFPVLSDTSGTPIDLTTFPQRFAYPPSEISLNGSNVNAVGEGINDYSSKVWWAN